MVNCKMAVWYFGILVFSSFISMLFHCSGFLSLEWFFSLWIYFFNFLSPAVTRYRRQNVNENQAIIQSQAIQNRIQNRLFKIRPFKITSKINQALQTTMLKFFGKISHHSKFKYGIIKGWCGYNKLEKKKV